jgi:hypothetical protein
MTAEEKAAAKEKDQSRKADYRNSMTTETKVSTKVKD